MESENETTRSEVSQNNEPHSGELKHICSICQKGFRYKCYLYQHVRFHSREKSFVCLTCNKQFIHKSGLKRHNLIHSGVKPHECPTCQKRFIRKGCLNKHLKIHLDARSYVCKSCQRKFNQKSSLTRHIRLHSGEKPFACDACKKRFALKQSLKGHLRVHSGEKPFSCSTCKKEFAQKSKLNTHLKSHSNVQQDQNSLQMETSSSKPKGLLQKYNEFQQYSSKGYSGNEKKGTDIGLEQNKSDYCFQVPHIKEENNSEDELADEPTPSCSYQNVCLKEEEPNENADATCTNLFDVSFVKEETIFIGNISTVKKEFDSLEPNESDF